MIKVFLINIITNQCIDIFFDKVTDNFIKPRLPSYGLIRKCIPELFAFKAIAVAPISEPSGIHFAMRYIRSQLINNEYIDYDATCDNKTFHI